MPLTSDCLPWLDELPSVISQMYTYRTRQYGPSMFGVLCTHTHSLIELLGFDFGEPYKSLQEVYKNAFRCRLFAMAWRTSVSGLGVVQLVY